MTIYRIVMSLLCALLCGAMVACNESPDSIDDDIKYTINISQSDENHIIEGDTITIIFSRVGISTRPTTLLYVIDDGKEKGLSWHAITFADLEAKEAVPFHLPYDANEVDEQFAVFLKEIVEESEQVVAKKEFTVIDIDRLDCRADEFTECAAVREMKDGKVENFVLGHFGIVTHGTDQDWFQISMASGLLYRISFEILNMAQSELDSGIEVQLTNALNDVDIVSVSGEKGEEVFYTPGNYNDYWLKVELMEGVTGRKNYAIRITQIDSCTDNIFAILNYHTMRLDNHIADHVRDGMCEVRVGERISSSLLEHPDLQKKSDINLHYINFEPNTRYTITLQAAEERKLASQLRDIDDKVLVSGDWIGSTDILKYETGDILENSPPFIIRVFIDAHNTNEMRYGNYTVLVEKEEK